MRFIVSRLFLPVLLAPFLLSAQMPPQLPPGGLIQLQVAQPAVDVSSPATVTAEFDPPVVQPGEKTFYRVTVDATESSIQWPEKISAPPELKFGPDARGQMTEFLGNKFRSLTSFVYEVRTTAAGHFTVTNFTVNISGEPLEIPAASVDAVVENTSSQPARQLVLETSATNVFLGQPFHVRVMLPSSPANEIASLREIQINGDGLMIDKTATRQAVEMVNVNGQPKPPFICEMTATPIATGPLKFSAQGFTAAVLSAPISIHAQVTIPGGPVKNILLTSDPLEINVRPLPSDGELAGFTGAIGKFFFDPPQLSTNRIRAGEPVHLKIIFHGQGDLTRLTPPAPPRSRDWEIIADNPPAIGYTLIPLTDDANETPAIPFSYFDPADAQYVDLTIPPLPVTVVAQGLPTELPPMEEDESESAAPLKLSGLAPTPGKTAASLEPLQLRGWFVCLQLVPVMGFLALWQWDRRRRFLEAHPEIVRRRQARRALRREKSKMRKAASAGDREAFIRHAADAMKICCAPHFPAHPQALVCADVLARLDDTDQNSHAGETVRKFFASADSQFAATPQTQPDLLALQSDVDAVLLKLEEKL